MERLKLALILISPLLFIAACGGESSDDNQDSQTDLSMSGLAECLPQTGSAVICGTVYAEDGVTPLVNAEINLSSSEARLSNRTAVAFKGVADPDRCITDYSGEFACILPEGVYGDIELVVSLSGFDDSVIQATAILDDALMLSGATLTSNSNNRWVVITGAFDGVQVLLAQLKGCTLNDEYGNPFDASSTSAEYARGSDDCENKGLKVLEYVYVGPESDAITYLKSAEFHDNDALFVNCPTDYSYDSEMNQALQNFVAAGKHVYFSDQSDTWLTEVFPEKIAIAGRNTTTGNISAAATHAGLSSVIGSNLNITLDLPSWTAIDSVGADVTTFLEADISNVSEYSGIHPITVGWRGENSGDGCVFYTSYHIEGASVGSDQELAMKYLVQNIGSVCN